jgi:hypothetical protein
MPSHRVTFALTALALLAVGLYAATRMSDPEAQPMRTPEAVGGVALPPVTPVPTAAATLAPTPSPDATQEATPLATAVPTAVPTVTAATAPTATQTAPGSPVPAATEVAGDPTEAVLAFYRAAAGEDFDAAYALWNERMRTAYAREPNLDSRFDQTAAVTFSQLSVAEMSGDAATVQANFTETYESGASRQFIGYWKLVLVDGRWLLDEPHY